VRELVDAGTGVLIAGPPGVGKTRLAREAARAAHDAGFHVERVAATSAASDLPLGVFASFDEGPPAAEPASGFATPFGLLRRALLDRAGDARLLLVVDDVHVLDPTSAAFVYQLAHAGEAVVLATGRTHTLTPDEVVALWKDELCTRVELQPLAEAEVAQLLHLVLGGRVDMRSAHDLWRATQGNLLFLRELVLDGLARGLVQDRGGRWQWIGAIHAPRHVMELLESQLDQLPAEQRRGLELVALSEPLECAAFAELASQSDLDALLEKGLVVTRHEGEQVVARLAHPLTGDVAREQLSDSGRLRLLRDLAGTVPARIDARPAEVLRRVTWLLDIGEPVDNDSLIRAAKCCIPHSGSRVERFARAALAQGAGSEALVALAQQYMFSGRAGEADALLATAVETATQPAELVSLVSMRANNLTFGLGRADDAVTLLDAVAQRPGVAVDTLQSQAAPILFFGGRASEATAIAEALLATDGLPRTTHLRAVMALMPSLAVAGKPRSALDQTRRAFELIGDGDPELPFAAGQIATAMILAHQWSGELDAADGIARFGHEQGLERGNDLIRGVCALHLAITARWRGRVRTATELLNEAVDALSGLDVGFMAWAEDELRACAALAGLPYERPRAPWRHGLHRAEALRLEGLTFGATGDRQRAAAACEAAAADALASGMTGEAMVALFDAARHGRAKAVTDDLSTLAGGAEGPWFALLARATEALAHDDGRELDSCASEFETMGFVQFGAEWSRVAARAFERVGLPARQIAADRRADDLAARCEGIRSAMLDAGPHTEVGLTRRENDVAGLVADGLSNAAIAEQLGISVRTVETHLQRAFTKLGVHARSELAAALRAG
jgi:DNA-binding CsgD family transcriptional regulator